MQIRVRIAKSTDGDPRPHTFIEVEPDGWLEISLGPDELTTKNVASFVNQVREEEKPKADGSQHGHVKFATRAFNIGLIRDWTEHDPVEIPD